MPSINQVPAVSSPPTNIFGLVQYVAQRIPGYDFSEYQRELNSAYIHVWEEVSKLKNAYFTNTKTVTVAKAQFTFDFLYNQDGGLGAAVSQRLYQVNRIRVLPPAGGLLQTTSAMNANDPDFLAVAANPTATPTQTGPYYWYPTGRGSVTFALPLAVGTQIEVNYIFWPLSLTYLFPGTVSSSSTIITGVGTNFTQLLQPDFQSFIPTTGGQEELQVELLANGNQVYRVTSITNDALLTTTNPVNPVLTAGSPYVLAALPEIPREHIRVIASIATQKMYSIAQDDARVAEWTGIAEKNMQMMKDSLIERQSNNPPKKQRFPYGIGRRNRAFMR